MGPTAPAITGLILAGGRGSRMGGVDKGLQNFRGQSLAQQTLVRLQQQSLPPQDILINANRNLAAYQSLGVPVWPDSLDGFAGPLAGFLTGLEHCQTPLLRLAAVSAGPGAAPGASHGGSRRRLGHGCRP